MKILYICMYFKHLYQSLFPKTITDFLNKSTEYRCYNKTVFCNQVLPVNFETDTYTTHYYANVIGHRLLY